MGTRWKHVNVSKKDRVVKTCQDICHERWMQKRKQVCFSLKFFLRIAAVLRRRGSGSRATYVSRWEVRMWAGCQRGNRPHKTDNIENEAFTKIGFLLFFVHLMWFAIHCVTWLLNQIACCYAHVKIALKSLKGEFELTCLHFLKRYPRQYKISQLVLSDMLCNPWNYFNLTYMPRHRRQQQEHQHVQWHLNTTKKWIRFASTSHISTKSSWRFSCLRGWMCHVWTCLIQLLLSRASNRYWSCWMNIPYVQWRIWCEREQPKIPNFVNRCLGCTIFSVALGWTLGRWKINVEGCTCIVYGPRDFYSCCIYACMMVHSGNANPSKASLPQGSSKSMDLLSKFPILCLWDIS